MTTTARWQQPQNDSSNKMTAKDNSSKMATAKWQQLLTTDEAVMKWQQLPQNVNNNKMSTTTTRGKHANNMW